MDGFVFLAVLFAAACHAGWNASIKRTLDPLATTALIALGAGAVALVFVPFVGIPAPASWPWLVASIAIHLFYFAGLIESYRAGDLGQVYPIARGSAPLMTAAVTTFTIGERLGLAGLGGIVLLAAGVLLLSLRGGRDIAALDRRAVGFALFTAVTICALFGGRRHWRAARRAGPRQRLFVLAVRRHRAGGARLCAGAPRRRGHSGDDAALEDRSRRRRDGGDFLLDRDLGDDSGADRNRRGACARPACCSARSSR